MTRVAVSPRILQWARTRVGKDLEQLRAKFPRIAQWETEEVRPTLKQLEAYARATRTPFGYFFLEEPPAEELPIPHFRTHTTAAPQRPSPDLLETVQTMQRRQDWLREVLIEDGEPRVPFIGTARLEDPIEAVAARIRDTLGLNTNWAQALPTWTAALQKLRDVLDAAGVVVVTNGVVGNNTHRKLDPAEFRGFVLVDEYAPLVFINGSDAKAAQMFTLAHECAHLWFGQSAVFDLRELQPASNRIEIVCNAVAAELLVAETELRAQWDQARMAERPFEYLARYFKVSAIVAARRTLDLQLITRNEFFDFYQAHLAEARQRAETTDNRGGDFYLTQNVRLGRRFALAVVNAVEEGRLTYREAYGLTDLWGQTFDKYAAELQGQRRL
ncbi:MAG: ImmA/IrrE family metallo-endopeptidase [Phycisphaerae bacterium]|jgi:Zn-dependent peptidase ImmA (M78 family)/transcriptional regulator with XRE-family HTH domain